MKRKSIQKMGGEATLKKYGRKHYVKMAKKATKARRKLWNLAKKAQKKSVKHAEVQA